MHYKNVLIVSNVDATFYNNFYILDGSSQVIKQLLSSSENSLFNNIFIIVINLLKLISFNICFTVEHDDCPLVTEDIYYPYFIVSHVPLCILELICYNFSKADCPSLYDAVINKK